MKIRFAIVNIDVYVESVWQNCRTNSQNAIMQINTVAKVTIVIIPLMSIKVLIRIYLFACWACADPEGGQGVRSP